MSQNQTEMTLLSQGQTDTKPDTQITVERLKLWIAVSSLAAALAVGVFSIYQSNLQSQRLRTVTVAIKDTDEIRTALQKPLEGVWQYRMVFSKYFGQDVTYIASGTAIILWDAAKQQYQVFIGYSIANPARCIAVHYISIAAFRYDVPRRLGFPTRVNDRSRLGHWLWL